MYHLVYYGKVGIFHKNGSFRPVNIIIHSPYVRMQGIICFYSVREKFGSITFLYLQIPKTKKLWIGLLSSFKIAIYKYRWTYLRVAHTNNNKYSVKREWSKKRMKIHWNINRVHMDLYGDDLCSNSNSFSFCSCNCKLLQTRKVTNN